MAEQAPGLASAFVKRISRFLINKKLLSELLKTELEERQLEVVQDGDVALHLRDLELKTEPFNSALFPGGAPLRVEAVSIRRLIFTLKVPSLSSALAWARGAPGDASGLNLAEAHVEGVSIVLSASEPANEPARDAGIRGSQRSGGMLEQSLLSLRHSIVEAGKMADQASSDTPSLKPGRWPIRHSIVEAGKTADQDIPDGEEDDGWEGGDMLESDDEEEQGAGAGWEEALGGNSRAALVRFMEKVLGATKLSVSDLNVRVQLPPDAPPSRGGGGDVFRGGDMVLKASALSVSTDHSRFAEVDGRTPGKMASALSVSTDHSRFAEADGRMPGKTVG
ncbi:hypothetical protein T484DRAFT_1793857 [Baffinella frigidus]|nr:hypothetical protein T484DRAFT_1793857 [Cryptophyta sp. CCMP2293]